MSKKQQQRGGFLMGMIVGLLIGLALALGVALYVTKVPVPFVNKVPQRTADQDAAEAQRNKNWDPNAPLSNRSARPNAGAASGQVSAAAEPQATASAAAPAASGDTPAASAQEGGRDPAAILSGQSPRMPPETAAAKATGDGFSYFVQAGAYARTEDAEQQRARLGLLGFDAKVTEREQAGRTVYRVRIGPFPLKDQADATKTSLDGAGIEAALVRVQK